MANLELRQTEKGYYDIDARDGHLAVTQGLDTRLLMSLFVDKRADDSEQPIKELQRGWSGNVIISDIPDYEIGCKQWLYIEQGIATNEVAQKIKDTVRNDGLQWLIDDNLAQEVTVEAEVLDFNRIELTATVRIDENNIEEKKVNLWLNTGL